MLQGKFHSSADKSPQEWLDLLWDLKSNFNGEDPDQHANLDGLTSFFLDLYNFIYLLSFILRIFHSSMLKCAVQVMRWL